MSKFIDKLKQVSQAEPQAMGFKAAKTESAKPRMLLVANWTRATVSGLADCVSGADAVLLPVPKPGSGAKTRQKVSQSAPDIPWGVWLKDTAGEGVKQAVQTGGDFVIFGAASTYLGILQDDKVGRILQVDASVNDSLLRAIDSLPVDAVLIDIGQGVDYSLAWHHLMLFRRFTGLLTKPLLVPVPANAVSSELQVLWDVGVDGVIVGAGQPAEGLRKLRQAIDGLALPSSRKRVAAEALLPYISRGADVVTDEEEEEE